ncbi:hypothetical protein Y032_0007g3365 [Ancylostoma ceylanicum]|uniref:Uncharacterized protein n=1 Tax=Ancylostoma ceylanicum TaxID=53326 RepID=A0A016VN09_9BILA|nr:hypothetical protein Y032_0007g3365 [Ancylostoma ceylanicum]
MDTLKFLVYILTHLVGEVPIRTRRSHSAMKIEQQDNLAVLPPELSGMRKFAQIHGLSRLIEKLAKKWLDDLNITSLRYWIQQILEASTIVYNRSCGKISQDLSQHRVRSDVNATTCRFPCRYCTIGWYTMTEHLDERFGATLRYPLYAFGFLDEALLVKYDGDRADVDCSAPPTPNNREPTHTTYKAGAGGTISSSHRVSIGTRCRITSAGRPSGRL